MSAIRQHLIDPEICIRCNTCEESCPIDAITHNDDNYVVIAEKCDLTMNCIAPCPTGAIDNWRVVATPYTIEQQFGWEELPEQTGVDDSAPVGEQAGSPEMPQPALEDEVRNILDIAHSGEGKVIPPFSAAQPSVNIYTRAQPAIARVAGNFRITEADSGSDIHHIVLDFGHTSFPVLEGQSIGIMPPGIDARGKPHVVRLYSVASPRDGERQNHNNLSLTVKRVVGVDETRGPGGVCSNYLCDLEKANEVRVTGPFGDSFLMPNHPEARLIMICTGTGSAPFRAMTERRRRQRSASDSGRILLFFGARSQQELPYFGPLMKLPDDLIDKEIVFSRLPDQPREYVQDRMLTRAEDIAAWLDDANTYIYVCGLKGMESGVNESLSAICRAHGKDWDALGEEMRLQGRMHIETY